MPDYRFARTPKWVAGHLLVVALVVLFVNLGLWQLRRLDERRADNALIQGRAQLDPEPVGELADPGMEDPDDLRFRTVTASGSYRSGADVAVRASDEGRSGARVFSLLDLDGGESVVVLRGFTPVAADGGIAAPPPPEGEVEVEGVAIPRDRLEAVFRQGVDDLPLDGTTLPVVVQAATSDADAIEPVPPPDLGEGPHLAYAVQWFVFSAVGVIGYPILLRRRARDAG